VPHFIGLHAIQALTILGLAVRRWRRPEHDRVRLVFTGAVSYAALFGLLLWQALRGESVVAPDATAATSLAIWAAASALAVLFIAIRARHHARVTA
jgi:hypothetical protein